MLLEALKSDSMRQVLIPRSRVLIQAKQQALKSKVSILQNYGTEISPRVSIPQALVLVPSAFEVANISLLMLYSTLGHKYQNKCCRVPIQG